MDQITWRTTHVFRWGGIGTGFYAMVVGDSAFTKPDWDDGKEPTCTRREGVWYLGGEPFSGKVVEL